MTSAINGGAKASPSSAPEVPAKPTKIKGEFDNRTITTSPSDSNESLQSDDQTTVTAQKSLDSRKIDSISLEEPQTKKKKTKLGRLKKFVSKTKTFASKAKKKTKSVGSKAKEKTKSIGSKTKKKAKSAVKSAVKKTKDWSITAKKKTARKMPQKLVNKIVLNSSSKTLKERFTGKMKPRTAVQQVAMTRLKKLTTESLKTSNPDDSNKKLTQLEARIPEIKTILKKGNLSKEETKVQKRSLNDATNALHLLKSQMKTDQYQAKIDHLGDERQIYDDQLQSFNENDVLFDKDIKTSQKDYSDLKSEIKKESNSDEIKELKKEIKEKTKLVSEIESMAEDQNEDEENVSVGNETANLKELREELADAKHQLQEKEQSIEKKQQTLDTMKEDIATLKEDKYVANKNIRKNKAELDVKTNYIKNTMKSKKKP